MTDIIRWVAKFSIHEGMGAEFKASAKQFIERVEANEAETALGYEWFFNEDESECCLFESYKDSAAVMAHMANTGDLFPAFFKLCQPISFEIYGNASAEIKEAFARNAPKYFGYWAGLKA